MQQWTEELIRRALDGTFTRFDTVNGGVRTAIVEPDHRPSHHISAGGGSTKGVSKDYRRFSPADDAMIMAMKAKGFSARHIARAIGRHDDTGINKRYRRLVATGRCQAVVA